MNNDLIFVTAHCPTKEQEDRLRLCVDNLIIEGFDLAIISHTHIPLDIQQKCQYYIYDQFNELVDDEDLRYFEYHEGPEYTIQTKYFKKVPFYGLAIYRMFSIISKLAENFNYERIYHVEYDYLINDKNIFQNHKIFLQKFDSIFYTIPEDDNLVVGGFKSFRVDRLPQLFKNFNRKEILSRIRTESLLPLENFTKKIFSESGNSLFISVDLIRSKVQIKKFETQQINWAISYNIDNDNIGIFYINMHDENLDLFITTNRKNNFTLHIGDKVSSYIELGKINEVNHISIFKNQTIFYESDITSEFKEKIKTNSIVRKN